MITKEEIDVLKEFTLKGKFANILGGIYFHAAKKNFVATDGKRLVVIPSHLTNIEQDFIFDPKDLPTMKAKATISFELCPETKQLFAHIGNAKIKLHQISGDFPMYEKFINPVPQSQEERVKPFLINPQLFATALIKMQNLTGNKSKAVKIEVMGPEKPLVMTIKYTACDKKTVEAWAICLPMSGE